MRKAGVLYCNCCGKTISESCGADREEFFHFEKTWGYFSEKMEPVRLRISVNPVLNSGCHSFEFRHRPWKGRKYLNVRCMFTRYGRHDAIAVSKINCVDDTI